MARSLRQVFSTDTGLTLLLVSLAVVLFVIYPFVPLGGAGRLAVTLGLTVVLVAGSFSVSDRPHLRWIVIGLAAVAIVANWLRHAVSHDAMVVIAHGSTILFLALTAGGVLGRVLQGRRVTSHHIQGAVAVYLMLGLIWGFVYALVELRQPGSFNRPAAAVEGSPADPGDEISELIYFSFVTLATLGYGEITPRSASARTLAIVEALVGQLYLVILIARLVSMRASPSDRES